MTAPGLAAHGADLDTPPLERAIVEHIARVRFEDLPAAAVEAAQRTLLWAFATAIAGAGAPGSDAIAKFVLDPGGREEATVIGIDRRAPAAQAAFANACFAKAYEYEDKYWLDKGGGFAMGFAIAPTALAVAEAEGNVDGRQVLTAIAVAVDLQARLLSAIRGEISPTWTGWNSTYLFCNYGAAIAAAKIMRLSEEQLLDTLGLIHAQACGNFQGQMEGVLGIRLQAGFAVRNGIAAAQLARAGITGAHQFLSGRFGFYKLHYGAHTIDYDSILDGLGKDYLGIRLGFKGYPCGVVAHPVLDAIRQLRPGLALNEIRAIRVYGTPMLEIMSQPKERRRNPHNAIDAQFSLPWVISCVLRDGDLLLHHFDDDLVHDDSYRQIAQTVDVDMQGRDGVTVEIETADGSIRRSDPVEFCRGHPDNPIRTEEMAAVFRRNLPLSPAPFKDAKGERILASLLAMADVGDVRNVLG